MKKKSRKNKILIFTNVWSREFIRPVLEDIKKCAAEDNVDLFVFTSLVYANDNVLQNGCQLNLFKLPNPEDFDGAIIFSNTFNLTSEEDHVREYLQNSGLPVVSTEVKIPGMAFVGTDNYKGMYELTNHLIEEHNCKEIVYLSGIKENKENILRKQAVEDALAEHKLALADVIDGDFGYYVGRIETKKWIENNKRLPDAFVCANDFSALGAIAGVYEKGYEVPRDVIVTGFDFNTDARTSDPLLATVQRDWDKMGSIAYKELQNQIDEYNPDVEINLSAKFVPSETCGCKPTKDNMEFKKRANREAYGNVNELEMLDYFFKNLRIATADVRSKAAFNSSVTNLFNTCEFMGTDFWICTEPAYFEIPDREYAGKITRISKHLDVLYSKERGRSKKAFDFDTKTLVPGYKKAKDESNVYIFAPLNNMDHIIGYVVTKNNTDLLYRGMLYNWIINMNGIFYQMRNIIFAEKTNEQLRIISMTDQLTGMYNRLGLTEELGKYITANRRKGIETTLLFADIDSMKYINDYFGHLKGDMAIKATADALKENLGEEWKIARFGGDEFVIVGTIDENENANKFRLELTKRIREYVENLDLGFPLSISIGITKILPKEKCRMEDYIKIADDSMYQEKEEAHLRLKEEMKKYKKQIL